MRVIVVVIIALFMVVGCSSEAPTEQATTPTAAITPTPRPTNTPIPTLTPAITATPLPTDPPEATAPPPPPSPIPADERDFELCVGIASDSNGYGHVNMKRPDRDRAAIVHIAPLAEPLRVHLDDAGLDWLAIADHSLSAGGLTISSSNYLSSGQLVDLRAAHCMVHIITPFYPDIAVGLSTPEDYLANLNQLIRFITDDTPQTEVLVFDYYMTDRAPFTESNLGFATTPERIALFNAALAGACMPDGVIGSFPQVTCYNTQPLVEGSDYLLQDVTRADFNAALHRSTTFTADLEAFFEENPEGRLQGDGIHLSLAGRDQLARAMADLILETIRTFD